MRRKLIAVLLFALCCCLLTGCKPQAYVAHLKDYKVDARTYTAKSQDERVRMVVLHYTVCDEKTSVHLLTEGPVSAHFGEPIYQLVEEDKRAWDVGVSYWRGYTNLNDISIGIEIVNPGYEMVSDSMIFRPFEPYQIRQVGKLMQDLLARYPNIDAINVIGHADAAPDRKEDPGAAFPWKQLYEKYDVGAWYDENTKAKYLEECDPSCLTDTMRIKEIQKDFELYGYEIEPSGQWDAQTEKVIFAFQLHFRPEAYTGELDTETYAILEALLDKYRRT